MFKFSKTSSERLKTVHPKLQIIAHNVLQKSPVDFGIAQGIRTLDQQQEYIMAGKSKTPYSRHLSGFAIDIYAWDGKAIWDKDNIKPIAELFIQEGIKQGVNIQWGGDWGWDAPHLQLTDKQYPTPNKIIQQIKQYSWKYPDDYKGKKA